MPVGDGAHGLSDDALRSKKYECLNQRVKLILVYKSWFNIPRYEKKRRVQTKVGEKDLKCFRAGHGNEFARNYCVVMVDSMRRNK